MSSYLPYMDVAKGLCILLVVVGHVERGLVNADILQVDTVLLLDSVIYTFHMPVFLCISGFFVERSVCRYSLSELITSKIDVIVYPYVLWMILQGGVEVILAGYTNGSVDVERVFSVWNPRAQFWYLYVLFFLSIISIFIVKNYVYLLLAVCFSLIGYAFFTAGSPALLVYFLSSSVFFFIGVQLSKSPLLLNLLLSRKYFPILFFAFILSQFVFHTLLQMKYNEYGMLSFLNTIVSIAFVLSFSKYVSDGRRSGWLIGLGKASILIYLGHILSGSGARIVLTNIFGVDNGMVHCFFGILLGIVPWFVLYKISNRYIILQWLYRSKLKDLFLNKGAQC